MKSQFTQIKDHWSEQRQFVRRVFVCAFLVVGLTGLVITRLVQLQIANFEYYSAQSQGNRIRVQPLPPTRGLIFDRNGVVLAENLPTWELVIIPEEVADLDSTLDALEALGLVDLDDRDSLIELVRSRRGFERVRLRNLSEEEAERRAVALIPIGRMVESEDIADLVLFLVSDRAAAITG